MIGKQSGQMDVFDTLIFNQLLPENHLLVKVNELFDFSFVYDLVKDNYHLSKGRKSIDPVVMFKLLVIEYLYDLSDVEVAERTQTDLAFRWFLKLSIDDGTPDDSSISHFRLHRLKVADYESSFNQIVKQCIEKNLVKRHRYQIDSTDVTANVSYPSQKKLFRQSFDRLLKQMKHFDEAKALDFLALFENRIKQKYQEKDKISTKDYYKIAEKICHQIYIETYHDIETKPKYANAYQLCYRLIDETLNNKKDKLISIVTGKKQVPINAF